MGSALPPSSTVKSMHQAFFTNEIRRNRFQFCCSEGYSERIWGSAPCEQPIPGRPLCVVLRKQLEEVKNMITRLFVLSSTWCLQRCHRCCCPRRRWWTQGCPCPPSMGPYPYRDSEALTAKTRQNTTKSDGQSCRLTESRSGLKRTRFSREMRQNAAEWAGGRTEV